MGEYFLKRQNKVAQHITIRPILDLCKEMVRRYVTWVARLWWDQEGLELAGARTAATTAAYGEGESEGGEEQR